MVGAGVPGVDVDGSVVAVLNAAMRMAWVISFVWMSRTCWNVPAFLDTRIRLPNG